MGDRNDSKIKILLADPHCLANLVAIGQELLAAHGLSPVAAPETVILIENGCVYTHSTAALRILRQLRGLWSWLYVGMVVPRPLRDGVYRFVARHRYQWFGHRDACMLPTPALRQRFL